MATGRLKRLLAPPERLVVKQAGAGALERGVEIGGLITGDITCHIAFSSGSPDGGPCGSAEVLIICEEGPDGERDGDRRKEERAGRKYSSGGLICWVVRAGNVSARDR